VKLQSPQNPKIRFATQLRLSSAFRKAQGAFGVEGGREIQCAVGGGFEALSFYYCERLLSQTGKAALEVLQTRFPNAEIYEISEPLYAKIALREGVDGVYAVFKRPALDLASALGAKQLQWVLIAESIEKPGNLGALMRAADGAGVDGLLLAGRTVDPFGPNVIRASLGTVFSFPLAEGTNEMALDFCRKRGLRIIASLPDAKEAFWSADLKGPLALVLGSEAEGLSAYWKKCADIRVQIPMWGEADSLNVSVAGALLLYECARQRSLGPKG